ncbi:MAG: ComEC/Rec2 family competence protein [Pirellulales bacterium]
MHDIETTRKSVPPPGGLRVSTPPGGSGRNGSQVVAHHQPLVVILLACSTGIVLDHYWPMALATWLLLAIAAMASWFVLYWVGSAPAAAWVLLVGFVGFAGGWHHMFWHLYSQDEIGRFARTVPRAVCVRGQAVEAPKFAPAPLEDPLRTIPASQRSRILLRVESIRDGARWLPASGIATLLVEGHLLGVGPGDRIEVYGRMTQPPPASNPGEFDFATYRRTQRQLCLLRATHPDCVVVTSRSSGWNPKYWLARLRAAGSRTLWHYVGHEQAGLAAAVFLGQRERLEHDRTEAFVETGTIHLLAISGLHVGILVSVLMLALRVGWVSRNAGLLLIPAITLFYALLTDARPPVLRASLLITVMCIALYDGRRQLGFNTLAAAALIVLMFNPAQLFCVGTQLSFLAVGTLICFAPVWRRWQQQDALMWLIRSTRPLPIRVARSIGLWFWRLTIAGFVVWLVALPLVMHHFHLCSPIGIVLTPILYLPIAVALFCGLGVLLFGWLLPPVATAFGWVSGLSLGFAENTVLAAREVPFGYAWMSGPSDWWIVVFYAMLAFWALAPQWRPPEPWCVAALALWATINVMVPHDLRGHPDLRFTFAAVGHGCGILVELPDKKTLVYDAGRMGSPHAATRAISSVLWSRGYTHIDALIISHADADHFNSIPQLLQRFSVGVVYVSPAMRDDKSTSVKVLFEYLDAAGVPVALLEQGDRIRVGTGSIDVLHPAGHGFATATAGSVDNANSIVLAVSYQGRRIILPGDLEHAGLDAVMTAPALDCSVLLAPHHGSPNSDPHRVAAWCQPEWTIVSSGFSSVASPVLQAYSDRGQLLQTSACGAITVTIEDGKLDVAWMRDDSTPDQIRFLATPEALDGWGTVIDMLD